MKNILGRLFWNLDTFLSCVALVVVILSVSYGVLMRYLFGDPPVWTNELAAIAFTWLVFLGASVAFRKKMHIGIDLLVNHLSRQVRWMVGLTAHFILLVFLGYMVVYGVIFSIESFAQPTSIMRLPNTCFYSAVPVSFALMLMHQFTILRGHVRIRLGEH
ncbi:MAG: TRAP transporter small permease [Verrucomicrobia bacterium]|nr:TRAP transporter small permease [Verrucomicrobiota bacterium]MDA1069021.1 TRAP transporter small permease [Verrucomicrobiota bacterium]